MDSKACSVFLQLEITSGAIWINPFVGVLTITSLWPVAIIFMNVNVFLRSLNMVSKYAMYQVSMVCYEMFNQGKAEDANSSKILWCNTT